MTAGAVLGLLAVALLAPLVILGNELYERHVRNRWRLHLDERRPRVTRRGRRW